MLVWTATLVAGAAATVYAVHELCAAAARNAHGNWKQALKYPPDKDYYTYHFEKMDWDAHWGAQKSEAFWLWTAKACPKAASAKTK